VATMMVASSCVVPLLYTPHTMEAGAMKVVAYHVGIAVMAAWAVVQLARGRDVAV